MTQQPRFRNLRPIHVLIIRIILHHRAHLRNRRARNEDSAVPVLHESAGNVNVLALIRYLARKNDHLAIAYPGPLLRMRIEPKKMLDAEILLKTLFREFDVPVKGPLRFGGETHSGQGVRNAREEQREREPSSHARTVARTACIIETISMHELLRPLTSGSLVLDLGC